jgi:hypothetical protein
MYAYTYARVQGKVGLERGIALPTSVSWISDAVQGLQFMHDELKVVHGGIKLNNLLLEEIEGGKCMVKLAHNALGDKVIHSFFSPWLHKCIKVNFVLLGEVKAVYVCENVLVFVMVT